MYISLSMETKPAMLQCQATFMINDFMTHFYNAWNPCRAVRSTAYAASMGPNNSIGLQSLQVRQYVVCVPNAIPNEK